jgi:hypothetical protein
MLLPESANSHDCFLRFTLIGRSSETYDKGYRPGFQGRRKKSKKEGLFFVRPGQLQIRVGALAGNSYF